MSPICQQWYNLVTVWDVHLCPKIGGTVVSRAQRWFLESVLLKALSGFSLCTSLPVSSSWVCEHAGELREGLLTLSPCPAARNSSSQHWLLPGRNHERLPWRAAPRRGWALHPVLEPFQGPSGVRSQDAEIGLKGQSWKCWNSPGRCRRQSCSRPWCSSCPALGVWLTQSRAGTVPVPSTLLEWELLPSLPSHLPSGRSSPSVSVSKVLAGLQAPSCPHT